MNLPCAVRKMFADSDLFLRGVSRRFRCRGGRLLDDGSLRVRLAQGARKLIEQDFDIHSNTARQRAIFSEAIALGQRVST